MKDIDRLLSEGASVDERYRMLDGESLLHVAVRSGQQDVVGLLLMERFVEYYNGVRLHSAIGYIAPLDFMAGKAPEIWSERDRKLEQAREARRERRSNKVPA